MRDIKAVVDYLKKEIAVNELERDSFKEQDNMEAVNIIDSSIGSYRNVLNFINGK